MDRPINIYSVPARVTEECGVKEVGLVQLTAREQLDAIDRAQGKAARVAIEYIYSSLRIMDGAALSIADGTVEKAWGRCSPSLLELVVSAYGDLHNPQEGEFEAFRASRRVQVG